MIKKIISGGQTGADRAALDVAIKLGIPHGGAIPRGRITENGPLPGKYRLQELPTESYSARTEKNVIDSDGTLIVSHGKLTGGSEYTRKVAMKHIKPWFHADLNNLPTFQAAMIVQDWIAKNGIETLNIAGPRASEDPLIYGLVTVILELVYNLETAGEDRPEPSGNASETIESEITGAPKTVDEAVSFLLSKLSLKDKATIAKMSDKDLNKLHFSLGLYIRSYLLYPRNDELLESCRQESRDKYLHWDQAPAVIIQGLAAKLRASHKLRVVKTKDAKF